MRLLQRRARKHHLQLPHLLRSLLLGLRPEYLRDVFALSKFDTPARPVHALFRGARVRTPAHPPACQGLVRLPGITHQIPDSVKHLSLDNCWIDSTRQHFPHLEHLAVTTFQRSSWKLFPNYYPRCTSCLQIELDRSHHVDLCLPLPPISPSSPSFSGALTPSKFTFPLPLSRTSRSHRTWNRNRANRIRRTSPSPSIFLSSPT
jgi:hypothetical protein